MISEHITHEREFDDIAVLRRFQVHTLAKPALIQYKKNLLLKINNANAIVHKK